eukprot:SM000133S26783  [mRNA]  locus=s133:18397:21403:- [translate_table: standard]
MAAGRAAWDAWLDAGLAALRARRQLRCLRPLNTAGTEDLDGDVPPATFHGPGSWDRSAVEVSISSSAMDAWLNDGISDDGAGHGMKIEGPGGPVADASNTSCQQRQWHQRLLLFSGNDYLGLSAHPSVRTAAAKAATMSGMGPRAAPLVCGHTSAHARLEAALARLKGTEDCLLCPTGFAANLAVFAAVAAAGPNESDVLAIFSDELNHASIIDGARLARAASRGATSTAVYRHNDVAHLDELLSCCSSSRRLVVTNSLFSMDGDFAPMREIAALRAKHGFLWVIDEAHATLVCGERGGGAAEAAGVAAEVDLHVGTLSKALGCHGGFIACSHKWKSWLASHGRAFVYSTALPVPVAAAAQVMKVETWRRKVLWAHVAQLSDGLGIQFCSPIAPVIIGSTNEALCMSRELLRLGFHVPAIRPPTVAKKSSR